MMPAAGLGDGVVPLPNDEELKVSQSLTQLGELGGNYGMKVCKLLTITNHLKTHGSDCLTHNIIHAPPPTGQVSTGEIHGPGPPRTAAGKQNSTPLGTDSYSRRTLVAGTESRERNAITDPGGQDGPETRHDWWKLSRQSELEPRKRVLIGEFPCAIRPSSVGQIFRDR